MNVLNVAAIQTSPVPGDVEATLDQIETQVASLLAMRPHVDLVVLPELIVAAPFPFLQHDSAFSPRAPILPGAVTERLAKLASDQKIWFVPGSLVEQADDGQQYNTALVFNPQGEIAARYRKLFPWRPYEKNAPGDAFTVFDIPGIGRLGLAICYDGSFPEVARQLAWLGAEIIIQPTLTTTRDRDMEIVMARANAFTNQVFIVNVNASSPGGVGESVLVDPEGMVMQCAGSGEEVLLGVLDLDRVALARRFGSYGLNQPWAELVNQSGKLAFPMYGGATMVSPSWQA
jgi:formamidase